MSHYLGVQARLPPSILVSVRVPASVRAGVATAFTATGITSAMTMIEVSTITNYHYEALTDCYWVHF